MKRKTGIIDLLAVVRARSGGDPFNVSGDWRSLLAVADTALERYQIDKDARQYLRVLESVCHVVGTRDARDFRERHRTVVREIAPDSNIALALTEPPSLEMATAEVEELARVIDLDDFRPASADPDSMPMWEEPSNPVPFGVRQGVDEHRVAVLAK